VINLKRYSLSNENLFLTPIKQVEQMMSKKGTVSVRYQDSGETRILPEWKAKK